MNELQKETRIYKVDPQDPALDVIERAAEVLRQGGTVAFPTETVYGLGANALSASAVAGIFLAKGRPADNPLIVHVASREDCLALTERLPDKAQVLMDHFWPGPLTLVVPKKEIVPDEVTAGLGTVGIRMPDHPVALALIRQAGIPVAAPSANLSGRPSPTTGQHVIADLQGRVDVILDGGETGIGLESTVLDLTGPVPTILRPGGVTREDLLGFLERVDMASDQNIAEEAPRSPGMKYRHYAPRATMQVVIGEPERVRSAILERAQRAQEQGKKVGILAHSEPGESYSGFLVAVTGSGQDLETTAHRLYSLLRWLDEKQVDLILAEGVVSAGLGTAIMNRLCKAAGYHILQV